MGAAYTMHAVGFALLGKFHATPYNFKTAANVDGIRRRPALRSGPGPRGLEFGPEHDAEIDFAASAFALTGNPKPGDNITDATTGQILSVVRTVPAGHLVTVEVRT